MKQGLIRSKDQVKNLADDGQITPEEYAQDKVKYWSEDVAHDTVNASKKTVKKTYDGGKKLVRQIKERKKSADTIKQTAKSTGKQTFKTMERNIKTASKTAQKGVKTAERSARTTIKTVKQAEKAARQTAKAAKKAAKASAKAAKKSAEAARRSAQAAAKTARMVAHAVVLAVKGMVAGVKALVAMIASGGAAAVIAIIIITIIALIIGSCFGIFYSGNDTGTGMTMRTAVADINTEYQNKLDEIRNSISYDKLEIRGGRALWQEVLSIYAVKTATNDQNGQEVASMDENKLEILRTVFWDMHSISSSTETKTETVITETEDENGNIVEETTEVQRTYLYITVTHKTVDEMAAQYGFNDYQKQQLSELLSTENASLWGDVLYGISVGCNDIVEVARTQLGNVGGQPYWSWYGFNSRVEWCACFVSWCANECGYIESGVIPKFAGCRNAVNWFQARGQWQDRYYTPNPGDIIFFDWEYNGISGLADHVGIVEKVDGNTVYTIEGNSGDMCAERRYTIGYFEVLGYAQPMY